MTPTQAQIRDVPHLTGILWSNTRHTSWLPTARTRFTDLRLMARVTRQGWVRLIRDGRGPVGFIARDRARIHALYVHPRAQGLGLGRRLLEDAMAEAPRLELWVLQVNTNARRFYAARDFVEQTHSSGAGNDENLPDVQMIWLPGERHAA